MPAPLTPQLKCEERVRDSIGTTGRDETRISRYAVEPMTYGDVRGVVGLLDACRASLEQVTAERDEALAAMSSDGADAVHDNAILRATVARQQRELAATREYLHDICDAHDAWNKTVAQSPGSGIDDPDYPGPSNEECQQHDEECSARWNDVEDAIKTACDAREEGEAERA